MQVSEYRDENETEEAARRDSRAGRGYGSHRLGHANNVWLIMHDLILRCDTYSHPALPLSLQPLPHHHPPSLPVCRCAGGGRERGGDVCSPGVRMFSPEDSCVLYVSLRSRDLMKRESVYKHAVALWSRDKTLGAPRPAPLSPDPPREARWGGGVMFHLFTRLSCHATSVTPLIVSLGHERGALTFMLVWGTNISPT